MFRIIAVIVGILLLAGLALYVYMGGFQKVDISKETFGPVEIIYSTHLGPYKNIDKSWTEFRLELDNNGFGACDSYGVYLDPPGSPPEELHSILACRIDSLTEEEKVKFKSLFPSFVLPETQALVSSFPYKNPFSFMLGPMKVYPKMGNRLDEEGLQHSVAIEHYGVIDNISEITFVLPTNLDRSAFEPLLYAF